MSSGQRDKADYDLNKGAVLSVKVGRAAMDGFRAACERKGMTRDQGMRAAIHEWIERSKNR